MQAHRLVGPPPESHPSIIAIVTLTVSLPSSSSASCSDLLKHADTSTGVVSDVDTVSPLRPVGYRTCIRLMDQSFKSSIHGAGLDITAEVGGQGGKSVQSVKRLG